MHLQIHHPQLQARLSNLLGRAVEVLQFQDGCPGGFQVFEELCGPRCCLLLVGHSWLWHRPAVWATVLLRLRLGLRLGLWFGVGVEPPPAPPPTPPNMDVSMLLPRLKLPNNACGACDVVCFRESNAHTPKSVCAPCALLCCVRSTSLVHCSVVSSDCC